MTKHSVTRWYHLAIAAVVPLVLTVCVTPTSISQLGDLDLDVDPPSATALAAAEPEAPALPLNEVAAAPQAVQPALDAGLLGAGGVAAVTPHLEPERPPHPVRLAVAPVGEVGVPGTLVGVGADGTPEQADQMEPERPPHPLLLAVAPVGEVGVPGTPVGVGADGTPEQADQMEPERPPHPLLLAVAPVGEVGVPGTPVGVGAGGTPEQADQMEPERPPHPLLLAVAPVGEVGVPGIPVGVGTDGTPVQTEYVMPTRPTLPVMAAAPISVPGEFGVPVGVGTDGTPVQGEYVMPTRPTLPVMAAAPISVPDEFGVPVGVGTDGTPVQGEYVMPTRPTLPVMAAAPISVPDEFGVPVGVGTDGTPVQGEYVMPTRPTLPVMAAAPISVPGEFGVPVGVGTDGTPVQGEYAMPTRPEHPVLVAARIGMPGELGVPVGAGTGGTPALGAHMEPPRPPHPELLAAVPMSALGEPGAPATANLAGAVRGRAGLVPPTTPTHPVMVAAVPVPLTYPQPADAVGPTIIQPPTDTDFDRVRVLIARAEEVDAQFYDPQNLDGAREALGITERIRSVDPGGSHIALRVAEARANAAFENSVRLAAERLRNLLQDRLEELREMQADLWVPASFQEMVDAVQRAEDLYQSGDYFGAYRLALATADDMLALRDSLLDRLELLYGARTETERCLVAARQLDTSDWSASRLKEMRSLYLQLSALYLTGLEAIQSYRLTDAEEAFGAATEVCRRLMAVADDVYTEQMERAAALLQAVMEEIEAASKLHVATELGDVIMPQPWSGQPVLDALRAGGVQRKAVLDGVDPGDAPADLEAAKGLLWTLATAKSLWIEGVVAFDRRKYGQSIRLFEDARRYVERYKFYAVLGIHVVQLILERRESLWRIAEYPRWYEDPFLWPRIWRRNRDLILNPDLIYPNWQLIIPAL